MCNNQVAWRKGNGAKSRVLGSSEGSQVPLVPLRAQPASVHRSPAAPRQKILIVFLEGKMLPVSQGAETLLVERRAF